MLISSRFRACLMLVDVAYVCLWKRQIQYSILFVSHIIGSYICMYITRSFGSKNIALKCYNITKMIERSLAGTQYTNIKKNLHPWKIHLFQYNRQTEHCKILVRHFLNMCFGEEGEIMFEINLHIFKPLLKAYWWGEADICSSLFVISLRIIATKLYLWKQ